MLLVFASCRDRHEQLVVTDNDIVVDTLLPTTPVKDQGRSELCWIYAMLATIETDRIAMGDSVHLSPLWLARKSLEEQALDCYLTGREVSLRGTLPEAMRLYNRYGILAYDAYNGTASRVVARKVQHLATGLSAKQRGTTATADATEELLDRELGPAPRYVFMLGMEYTPGEFARSCAMPEDWMPFTSFTHHPYGKPFCLELKDNRQHHEAMNVPIDSLYSMVVSSLRNRHPVAWEGSVSLCLNSKSEREKELNYAAQRQRAFESFRLTDDHCMAIIGIAHRRDGTPLLVCKNSWGKDDGDNGLRYMTREQFMMSTILVMVKQ